MSIIGSFTPAKDGGWTGRIRTLVMDAKVRLVPNDNRDNESAPAFRVLIGYSASAMPGKHDPVTKARGSIGASRSTIRVWPNLSAPRSSRPRMGPARNSSGTGDGRRQLTIAGNHRNDRGQGSIGRRRHPGGGE
jgi:hypothetical protein